MHLDLDAFFASVEQRDKPSLRGKPVVVGGVGGRGVVATASYEARRYGVRSAMSTREARSRCPHAAFLTGRFHAYRESQRGGDGGAARRLSPGRAALARRGVRRPRRRRPHVVPRGDACAPSPRACAARVREVTGGLTASVGIGTSKFIAKVASDLDKPDGLVVVPPGTEQDLLRPMHVTVIPGVGPATAERLRRVGITTVADLERVSEDELVRLLGKAHGHGLYLLARAEDDRPVVPERETKSVSVEGTYDTDLTDRRLMEGLVDPAGRRTSPSGCARTACPAAPSRSRSGSTTSPPCPARPRCAAPTDAGPTIARLARGPARRARHSPAASACSGSASPGWPTGSRTTCSARSDPEEDDVPVESSCPTSPTAVPGWPGMDVVHDELGRGWVWGAGRGIVTVRFETAETPPGPVRSLRRRRPGADRLARPG